MYQYILKRVLLMVPTVVGAGALIFFLMRVLPGDVCLVRWVDYGMHYDQAVIDICRNELGLNNPCIFSSLIS